MKFKSFKKFRSFTLKNRAKHALLESLVDLRVDPISVHAKFVGPGKIKAIAWIGPDIAREKIFSVSDLEETELVLAKI